MHIKTHPRPAFGLILMPYTRSIFPRRAPISPLRKEDAHIPKKEKAEAINMK